MKDERWRRKPVQKRAQDRLEHLHDMAEAMIIADGVNSLRLNELAAKAGVSVGSVYQYFPTREDLIRSLVSRYHRGFEEYVRETFAEVTSIEQYLEACQRTATFVWEFFETNRAYHELWCGAQSWAPLRKMDWEDTIRNANIMATALLPLLPNIAKSEIEAFTIVLCDASGSIRRLTEHLPDKSKARLDAFTAMMQSRMARLVEQNRAAEKPRPAARLKKRAR